MPQYKLSKKGGEIIDLHIIRVNYRPTHNKSKAQIDYVLINGK